MHAFVSFHTIRIDAPIDQCQRFFTPAGEELWVDGWKPRYLNPSDGCTQAGMVFTTGSGDEHTIWTLVDYGQRPHRARYCRVTPASRVAIVDVSCAEDPAGGTSVEVRYALTSLCESDDASLAPYTGQAFVSMIEDWRSRIQARLPELLPARIR